MEYRWFKVGDNFFGGKFVPHASPSVIMKEHNKLTTLIGKAFGAGQ